MIRRDRRSTWPDERPFRERNGRPIRFLAASDEHEPAWSSRRTGRRSEPLDGVIGAGDLDPRWLAFLGRRVRGAAGLSFAATTIEAATGTSAGRSSPSRCAGRDDAPGRPRRCRVRVAAASTSPATAAVPISPGGTRFRVARASCGDRLTRRARADPRDQPRRARGRRGRPRRLPPRLRRLSLAARARPPAALAPRPHDHGVRRGPHGSCRATRPWST